MMSEIAPDEEADDGASALNATLHREHWGRHFSQDGRLRRCVVVCREDAPRRPRHCPSCYGRAWSVPQWQAQLDPGPGRGEAFARGLGEWFAAFRDGLDLLRWRKPEPEPAWITVQVGVICKGEAFV